MLIATIALVGPIGGADAGSNQREGSYPPSDWPAFDAPEAQCHSVAMQAIAGLEHDAAPWSILQMLHPSSNCWHVGFSRIFSASVPLAEAWAAKSIETVIAVSDVRIGVSNFRISAY